MSGIAMTFLEAYRDALATAEQIHEWVERWHKGELGQGKPLREVLGMSERQYAAWMRGTSVEAIAQSGLPKPPFSS